MTQSRRQHHQDITVPHFAGNLRQPYQAIHLTRKDKVMRPCDKNLKGLSQGCLVYLIDVSQLFHECALHMRW